MIVREMTMQIRRMTNERGAFAIRLVHIKLCMGDLVIVKPVASLKGESLWRIWKLVTA